MVVDPAVLSTRNSFIVAIKGVSQERLLQEQVPVCVPVCAEEDDETSSSSVMKQNGQIEATRGNTNGKVASAGGA